MPSSKPQTVPRHLGIILDGNRRWAKEQGLPTVEGHRAGYENLKTIGMAALDHGVEYLSAYVFSTENWNRSRTEVNYLMRLLQYVVDKELDAFNKRGVKVRIAGSRDNLNTKVIQSIDKVEQTTSQNNRGELILCLNYGGRRELTDAVNHLVASGGQAPFTEDDIASQLYVPDVPDIDLLVRTSGEQRLSNFMLWRAAYSELLFVKKHWPSFTTQDLDDCLAEYARRGRRFGK